MCAMGVQGALMQPRGKPAKQPWTAQLAPHMGALLLMRLYTPVPFTAAVQRLATARASSQSDTSHPRLLRPYSAGPCPHARPLIQPLSRMPASQEGSSKGGQTAGAADRHTPWQPSADRDAKDPELAALLRKVAL